MMPVVLQGEMLLAVVFWKMAGYFCQCEKLSHSIVWEASRWCTSIWQQVLTLLKGQEAKYEYIGEM